MPFDNTSLLSYGKRSQSKVRPHNKTRYYAERNVVNYKPIEAGTTATVDLPCKTVPLIPNLSQIQLQSNLQKNSVRNSYLQKSRTSSKNMNSSLRESGNASFEKKYYVELEKNKNLENYIKQLNKVNNQLTTDKEVIKGHYEEFIARLQTDLNNAKAFENKYNGVDLQRRKLEEELNKLNIELNMLKKGDESNGNETLDELRLRIQTLNKEKLELMNSLKVNKKEVYNLRKEIKQLSTISNDATDRNSQEVEKLRNLLLVKENKISQLLNHSDNQNELVDKLDDKNKEIIELSQKIETLTTELNKYKALVEEKENIIKSLQLKLKNQADTYKASSHTSLSHTQPIIERTSIIRNAPMTERRTIIRSPSLVDNNFAVKDAPVRTSIIRAPTVSNIYHVGQSRPSSYIQRSQSPSPTVTRTVIHSPHYSREYHNHRRTCGCCEGCNSCSRRVYRPLSNVTHTINNSRPIQVTRPVTRKSSVYQDKDFTVKRQTHKPSSRSHTVIEPVRHSVGGRRRISFAPEPQINEIRIPAQRNTITFKNTDHDSAIRDSDRTMNTEQVQEKRNKSIELYKYCESSQNESLAPSEFNDSIRQSITENKPVFLKISNDNMKRSSEKNSQETEMFNVFQNSAVNSDNQENMFNEYQYYQANI